MTTTPLTLLEELREGGNTAWGEFDSLFRPMIVAWLRRYRLEANDLEDVTQDVMTRLLVGFQTFEHNGRLGAFRTWLRTVTANCANRFLKRNGVSKSVNADLQSMAQQLEDPNSDLSHKFNDAHDAYLLRELLNRISGEFADSTVDAFRKHVVSGVSAGDTATELGTTVAAVYTAKSRVLKRLRELTGDSLGDFRDS